jgi:hypothetical protein
VSDLTATDILINPDEVEWFEPGAADGVNAMGPALPRSLEQFIDHVVPLLQRRGLFRTEYSGRTLREHYGIPRPAGVSAQVPQPAERQAV